MRINKKTLWNKNLLYLHDKQQSISSASVCLLQYTCSLCIHLLKMLKTASAESVQVNCVMKENEPVTQLCSTPGKLQEPTLPACYSPLSNTHMHTQILLTRLPDKYTPIYICSTSLKPMKKWLINIKSRNQICFKLAVREWLSQPDRVVVNTDPWHLFECYERMREGVAKKRRSSERGNSWLTPVTGWMFVFLFIQAAHLISLCLLEIILWKWNGNNPNESLSHCDLLSVWVDGPIWLVFAHGWQLISC